MLTTLELSLSITFVGGVHSFSPVSGLMVYASVFHIGDRRDYLSRVRMGLALETTLRASVRLTYNLRIEPPQLRICVRF